ncbi:MAG: PilZ domain-containing protein [Candidatus Omnitrophica bacterium]|nr:PilZ domain-containing protein [Candidatus Omnitrophota bacterium]
MSPEYEGVDRRQHKRIRVNFIASYEIREPWGLRANIGNKEIYTRMYDLSQGGTAISSLYDIPLSSVLLIKFVLINLEAYKTLNRSSSLTVEGRVVYNNVIERNERRLGICFREMDDGDREFISGFVKRQSAYNEIS